MRPARTFGLLLLATAVGLRSVWRPGPGAFRVRRRGRIRARVVLVANDAAQVRAPEARWAVLRRR